MAKSDRTKFCPVCAKTLTEDNFYCSNNYEKYPDGKMNKCKQCTCLMVDNWDKSTFLPILEDADVPFVLEEWNKLLDKHAKDRSKVNGTTIIGRYIGKMRLSQFNKYRWADTEWLKERSEKIIRDAMELAGHSQQEIQETIDNQDIAPPPPEPAVPENPTEEFGFTPGVGSGSMAFVQVLEDDDDRELEDSLTSEDRKYLKIKWGKTYRPSEWIQLEDLYKKMEESYVIDTAGHEDTLKLVCKTSLKANQLLDIGDIDGATKMTKMYNDLMRSGRFTADQNKKENGGILNSVSELVTMCERDGFIPRFYVDEPKDRVDETLEDYKLYVRTLVTEEMGLGNLIENAVMQMQMEENREEDEDTTDDLSLDDLNIDFGQESMADRDFMELEDMKFDESMSDEDIIQSYLESEGE